MHILAKLEREMDKVQGQYQQAEHTYGADLLHLTVAKGYLTRLLGNEAVRRYLGQHQPEILTEFQMLVETAALDDAMVAQWVGEDGVALDAGDGEDLDEYGEAMVADTALISDQSAGNLPFEKAA